MDTMVDGQWSVADSEKLGVLMTERQTNKRTIEILGSPSRLKIFLHDDKTNCCLGYSTGTLMKENAERQELAENFAKCTRRAKAANASLRSSR